MLWGQRRLFLSTLGISSGRRYEVAGWSCQHVSVVGVTRRATVVQHQSRNLLAPTNPTNGADSMNFDDLEVTNLTKAGRKTLTR
jgi:hypothetical protein